MPAFIFLFLSASEQQKDELGAEEPRDKRPRLSVCAEELKAWDSCDLLHFIFSPLLVKKSKEKGKGCAENN